MKRTLFLLILTAWCHLTGCASLKPGADPLVVRCEQAEQVAFSTFNAFVHLVADHEAKVKATVPAAFTFAEWLRAKTADGTPRGLAMVTSLGNVRRAYAANRSPENKATVLGALAAVQAAIEESQRHLSTLNAQPSTH